MCIDRNPNISRLLYNTCTFELPIIPYNTFTCQDHHLNSLHLHSVLERHVCFKTTKLYVAHDETMSLDKAT